MKTRKFEARFEGRHNTGLRAQIRNVVNGARDPGAAVRAIAGAVALTALGKAILEEVAQDYDLLNNPNLSAECWQQYVDQTPNEFIENCAGHVPEDCLSELVESDETARSWSLSADEKDKLYAQLCRALKQYQDGQVVLQAIKDANLWAEEGGSVHDPVGDWDSEAFANAKLPADAWELYHQAFFTEVRMIRELTP